MLGKAGAKDRKTRKVGRFLGLSCACLALMLAGGCTASRPPDYLPSASSLGRGQQVTVGANETIYAVARKHKVSMRELIAVNELQPPFSLRAGQRLYLPTNDRYAAPVPEAAPLEPVDKGAWGPSREGTLVSSSSAVTAVPLDAPAAQPAASAALAAPSALGEPVAAQALPPPAKTANYVSSSPQRAASDMPFAVSKPEPEPQTTAAPWVASETSGQEAAQAASSSSSASSEIPSFAWPVRGTIISAFGPKGKGRDNDGINIAAPKGSPVKAAEGGIVAYAGNEMKGFGNLVLIRHEGGWVTAYAHMDRLVVARDTVVAKGDMIGTIGTTGGVSSPQLHFEARRDGKPTDPELVLK